MSIDYRPDGRLLRFEFQGSTAQEELYQVFHGVFREHDYDDDAVVLIDLRASTSLPTRGPQVVEMLSEFVLQHPGRPGDRVAVLLVPQEKKRFEDAVAELARRTGVKIGVFEQEARALAWAGVGSESSA